jgi:protein-S-isoprenylcysteine O-methyltransferase Ste14
MEAAAPEEAHPLVRSLAAFNARMSQAFLGGPRLLKLSWVINAQKGGTLLFIGVLMLGYRNDSTAAWVYLALHGTYGLCWLLKHLAFRDPRWDVRVTLGGAFVSFALVLGLYWVFPWLLISDVLGPRPEPSNALLALCIALHTLGVVVMMSADSQKHFTLRYRKGLVEDGMFRHSRNPNYLGEMMLYGAYALLVRHWIPWLILAWVWGEVFLINMLMKDSSLSRHPGWQEYKARTGLLLPWPLLLGRARRPTAASGPSAG